MAVSNFYNQTMSKLVNKKINEIYKPKPMNLAALSKKFTLDIANVNFHEDLPPIERVSYLAKTFKTRKYAIQCLIQKRNKLIQKLKDKLKEVSPNITIDDLFSSTNHEEVSQKEIVLAEMLAF